MLSATGWVVGLVCLGNFRQQPPRVALPPKRGNTLLAHGMQHSSGPVRSVYSFSLSTYGKAQVVELRQPPSEYRSIITGDLVLVGALGSAKLEGRLDVQSLTLTSGPDRLYGEEKALRSVLNKPFVIRLRNRRIAGCAFPGDVPAEGRKMIRTILAIAQLPGAAEVSGRKLIVDDVVGTKSIAVRARGPASLELTEKRYVGHTSHVLNLSLGGSWTARLGAHGVFGFVSLHGTEKLDAQVTKSSHSTTHLEAELHLTSTDSATASDIARIRIAESVTPEPLWIHPTDDEVRKSLAAHTLHGLNGADVFRIVDQLGTKDQTDQSGTDAFSKLRALVIVSDDAARETGRRLLAASADSPQFVVYGQALMSGGSPLSQKLFLDALRARSNESIASQKLVAELIGLDRPTTATVETLSRLSEDHAHPVIASSSVLVLGRFAGRLAHSSPKESAALVRRLGAALLAAKSTDDQRLYVGALGNAGQASCLPYLKRFTAASDAKVRADAVAALRFIPAQGIDGVLCDRLLHDKSEDVRAATVFAMGFRSFNDEQFGALVVALRNDPSERVRRTALSALWGQREAQPAIVTIVDEVSRKDPSKDVRKMAGDLLSVDRGKG